jgi:hypothetical protein
VQCILASRVDILISADEEAHLFWYWSSARAFQPAALSAPSMTPRLSVCNRHG